MKIGIIDYGVGNLGSVLRALEELRVAPTLINRATDMHSMDGYILPGVGNFSDCARMLIEGDWDQALRDEVQEGGKPLLGVCVGMQLLATCGTEGINDSGDGATQGLGFIPGRVEHLGALGCKLRVPHVGWNSVKPVIAHGVIFEGIPSGTDFYFVHSYAFVPEDPNDVIATTDYSVTIASAVRRGNVWGTQFHPEKSSRAGFRLLRNFIGE